LWNPDVVGMGGLIVVLFLIITGQVRVCDWLLAQHQLVVPSTKKESRFGAGQLVRGLRCAARRFMLAY